jgi:hypothetical protein
MWCCRRLLALWPSYVLCRLVLCAAITQGVSKAPHAACLQLRRGLSDVRNTMVLFNASVTPVILASSCSRGSACCIPNG